MFSLIRFTGAGARLLAAGLVCGLMLAGPATAAAHRHRSHRHSLVKGTLARPAPQTTLDQKLCKQLSGTWNRGPSTCEIKKSSTAKTSFSIPGGAFLQIDSSGSLTVNSGVTITNNSQVTVNGTLTNGGTITNGVGGQVDVFGSFTNNGTFNNDGADLIADCSGAVFVCGTIDNALGAVVNNTNSAGIDLNGAMTNSGTITNDGGGINLNGGLWLNIGPAYGGTLTNEPGGTINDSDTSGISVSNQPPSTASFTNDGTLDLFGVLTGGTVDNESLMTVEAGALVQIENTLTNGGTISNSGDLQAFALTNNGTITNPGTIEATFSGSGTCTNISTGTGCH